MVLWCLENIVITWSMSTGMSMSMCMMARPPSLSLPMLHQKYTFRHFSLLKACSTDCSHNSTDDILVHGPANNLHVPGPWWCSHPTMHTNTVYLHSTSLVDLLCNVTVQSQILSNSHHKNKNRGVTLSIKTCLLLLDSTRMHHFNACISAFHGGACHRIPIQ